MKITVNNFELTNYMGIIKDANSFRNNMSIKVPTRLDWALRKNLKKMNDAIALFEEARNDVGKEFVEAGKTENDQVKEEYRNEYGERITELMLQPTELDLSPVHIADIPDGLSMPERDFLYLMVEEKEFDDFNKEDEVKEDVEEVSGEVE